MALLEPKLAVLDETDSGLDIDALRIVSDGVNALRSPERSFVVITHYQRLLNYIVPDFVHVLSKGRIVRSGGKELALELEARAMPQYPRRGGLSAMNAELRPIRTAAEQALADAFASAKARLPGERAIAALREDAFDAFDAAGPAAPPRRGMEIHRSARADARRAAARGARRTPPRKARENAGCDIARTSSAGASSSSTALSCPRCPISALSEPA